LSDDPVKSASEGVASAVLDWSEQKVRDFVKQFLNRKLAFVKSAENIELIKHQRSSSEYSVLSQFVPKGPYSILVQMGLALREIENDKDRVLELVDRIRRKYELSGLHVAEITQIGITTQLLTRLLELHHDPTEVTKKLTYFLDHVEHLVIFVKSSDNPKVKVKVILTRIESFTAHMMVVFGSGYAKDVVIAILKEIKNDPRGYVIELIDEKLQVTAFIYTPEVKAVISHWSDAI
jgi:hypothetical protein